MFFLIKCPVFLGRVPGVFRLVFQSYLFTVLVRCPVFVSVFLFDPSAYSVYLDCVCLIKVPGVCLDCFYLMLGYILDV
jgi:hypothetical protein